MSKHDPRSSVCLCAACVRGKPPSDTKHSPNSSVCYCDECRFGYHGGLSKRTYDDE